MLLENIGTLVVAAVKELDTNNIPTTLENVSGILAIHQQAEDEDTVHESIEEALEFGTHYGVLRKKGTEYVLVDKARENDDAGLEETDDIEDSVADRKEFWDNIVLDIEKEDSEDVDEDNDVDKAKDRAEETADDNEEDSAKHNAEDDDENTEEFEPVAPTDVNDFSRDLMKLLARYAKRRRARRPRGRRGRRSRRSRRR